MTKLINNEVSESSIFAHKLVSELNALGVPKEDAIRITQQKLVLAGFDLDDSILLSKLTCTAIYPIYRLKEVKFLTGFNESEILYWINLGEISLIDGKFVGSQLLQLYKRIELVKNRILYDDKLLNKLLNYKHLYDKKGRNWSSKPYRGRYAELVENYNKSFAK